MTQPAVYFNVIDDEWVQSLSNGTFKKYTLTPTKAWGLGLNLAECSVVVRIKNADATFGITITVEFSPDGKTWTAGASAVITEKSAAGDYVGVHSTTAEILPYYRVCAQVRDTSVAAVKTAQVSVWQYMKYSSRP